MSNSSNNQRVSALPSKKIMERRQGRRLLVDHLAKYGVGIGGISVIIAITLIFFYLAMVVFPLFGSAEIEKRTSYALPGSEHNTLMLATEEQSEIGLRLTDQGEAIFFNLANGSIVDQQSLDLPDRISSFSAGSRETGIVAFGLANGSVKVVKHSYDVSYPDNKRQLEPQLTFPMGEEAIVLDEDSQTLTALAIEKLSDSSTIAALTEDGRIIISSFEIEESLMGDDVELEATLGQIEAPSPDITHLIMDKEQRSLFALDQQGIIHYIDISDKEEPELVQSLDTGTHAPFRTAGRLAGGVSLITVSHNSELEQWFLVRNENNDYRLQHIRSFDIPRSPVNAIANEYFRKGLVTAHANGEIALLHATAHNTLEVEHFSDSEITHIAFSPRANRILFETSDGQFTVLNVENEHPEISWSSLWGEVWYEGYEKPDYIWQSSSADNDFEPKLSLVPLSFGTIKAAFYAMLLAIPLAIFGAIYTAYFMAPKLRQAVKPGIEIMEALPTVILGFLAGLWLAPFVEDHLPGIFSLSLILPLSILGFAYAWHRLPDSIRHMVPDGWAPVLLAPVILLVSWFALAVSPAVELALFNGNMPLWMKQELGVDFDQRNSIIVGLAMGFAVIPTIFSIAEDAIFSVPKHLTNGSLALGATPWQTFTRVVILTASPGIFSGVMIGFGRAVGETMIVLMATGNTPVLDLSIFQGMRTLSANIAVEMPESEVDSTHYRVLFLAALVLFVFTFMFNTIAELVRQRLRKKYSSL